MLGRRSKNSAAAIRATTTHARLEALELTLLAVLPLLPRASRAKMAEVLCVYREVQVLKKAAAKAEKSKKPVAIIYLRLICRRASRRLK
jgi:hypothetical protein